MKKFTFLDAAYEILKMVGEPLKSEDITRRALDLGLLKTKGKTPAYTMAARLHCDVRDNGPRSRFIKVGPNLFGLIGWAKRYGIDVSQIRPKRVGKVTRRPKTKGFSEIADHQLLSLVKNEVRDIRSFIKGSLNPYPNNEKLGFWVWFSYILGFYREGGLIYRKIDKDAVSSDFYNIIRKIGLACEQKAR
ncbi:MAG: winged helix-turn-helix domain-containing protein [Candidatus Aerophobetes bacterium]|nr:winged helix-turn-helix domain-containing protein [Candidatus Aerophobetes bacterium]